MRASVVIVNHGTRDLLEACLRSLCSRVDPDRDEVIVVENGSPEDEVEDLEATHPEVRVEALEENVGFARAANHGAMRSRGEFILFLNSDTELLDDVIGHLVGVLGEEPGVAIAGPALLYPDGRHQPSTHGYPSVAKEVLRLAPRVKAALEDRAIVRWVAGGIQRLAGTNLLARYAPPDRPRDVSEVTGACFLMRREAFGALGGFDAGYFMYLEEADLCWRAARAGWKIRFDPRVRVVHHLGGSSRRAEPELVQRVREERYRSLSRFWSKTLGPGPATCRRCVLCAALGARIAAGALLALLVPARWSRVRADAGLWSALASAPPESRPEKPLAPVTTTAGSSRRAPRTSRRAPGTRARAGGRSATTRARTP